MKTVRPELLLWSASAIAFALLVGYASHGHGRLDLADHARGRDFVIFWTAGQLLREGRLLEVFDPAAFMAAAHRLFSPKLPFHFWSYPPPALFLVAPLAAFKGYFSALIAWTITGLAALWGALRLFPPTTVTGPGVALLLLSPAVAVNIAFGQNGAFTAALLLGGLALADRRPWMAGALLGLLIFKPQIALLLPVAVLAGRRWRMLGGAALSATALVLLSVAIFGMDAWRAFAAHTLPMQATMLQHGVGPFRWMMPSAFIAARLLGVDYAPALAAQAPFTLAGAWLVWRAWRAPDAPPDLRSAVLAMATFVATPQAFNYDLIPAAFAALAMWRSGGRVADYALATLVWVLPVAMIALGFWRVPLSPLILTAAAWRLSQLAARPSRAAKASTMGEVASNT